jgi:hypothetical protein
MNESASQKGKGRLSRNKPLSLLLGSLFRITIINSFDYRSDTALSKAEKEVEELIGEDALSAG